MLLSSQPTRCARILARGDFFFSCMLNKAILPFLPPFCDSKEKHRSNMYIEYYNKRNMHCVWGSGERERQRHREVETETHTHTEWMCMHIGICLSYVPWVLLLPRPNVCICWVLSSSYLLYKYSSVFGGRKDGRCYLAVDFLKSDKSLLWCGERDPV